MTLSALRPGLQPSRRLVRGPGNRQRSPWTGGQYGRALPRGVLWVQALDVPAAQATGTTLVPCTSYLRGHVIHRLRRAIDRSSVTLDWARCQRIRTTRSNPSRPGGCGAVVKLIPITLSPSLRDISEFDWVFTRPRPGVIIRQRRRQQVQGGSSRMGTVGEIPGDEGDDCSLGQALKPSGANGAMHTRMQGGTVFCER